MRMNHYRTLKAHYDWCKNEWDGELDHLTSYHLNVVEKELIAKYGVEAFEFLIAIDKILSASDVTGYFFSGFMHYAKTILHSEKTYQQWLLFSKSLQSRVIENANSKNVEELFELVSVLEPKSIVLCRPLGRFNDFVEAMSELSEGMDLGTRDFQIAVWSYACESRQYLHTTISYMLREMYGESVVLEILTSCIQNGHVLDSGEASFLAASWDELKDYPLDWSLSLHS